MSSEHGSSLVLEDEPNGPFRFTVWQPAAEHVDPFETDLNSDELINLFDVQLRVCETRPIGDDQVESVNMRRHRFRIYRYDFCTPIDMEITLAVPLELLGVSLSEAGIQQIFSYTIVQAQAIANDERNSNQNVIPIILFLESFTWLRDDNQGEHDNELSHITEESMHDSTFKPVPATKSSIEALEKLRLEDGSLASKEPCIICWEQFSSMVEVTRMPCSHLYHGDCIVQWLNISHMCPVCRFPMPCVDNGST